MRFVFFDNKISLLFAFFWNWLPKNTIEQNGDFWYCGFDL